MGLNYPREWQYGGITESIPAWALGEFCDLVDQIAGEGKANQVYEIFKAAFGRPGHSSDTSWARSDCFSAMRNQADNAVQYVVSFWSALERVDASFGISGDQAFTTILVSVLNQILSRHQVPLRIEGGSLLLARGDITIADDDNDGNEDGDRSSGGQLKFSQRELIGRGGFGAVYKVVRTTSLGEFQYAMKVHEPSVFNLNPDRAEKRFRREVFALQRLQHRGIVPYLEAGLGADGKPYLLMPLIDGTTLRDALSSASCEIVRWTFCEILLALEYAHTNGVIHRDLKPSNVIVRSSDEQPIIVDFGAVYILDSANEEALTTTLVGSQAYIPTEVIDDPKIHTPQQDVYACGVMLYEVLANCLPSRSRYEPLGDSDAEAAAFDPILRRALAVPDERFENAYEFYEQLEDLEV